MEVNGVRKSWVTESSSADFSRSPCLSASDWPSCSTARARSMAMATRLPTASSVCRESLAPEIPRLPMARTIPRSIKLFLLRKEKLSCTGLETLHDVIRYRIHQLDDVAFSQQFLAEFVEPFDLAAAAVRLVCFSPDPRGELAAHDGGN